MYQVDESLQEKQWWDDFFPFLGPVSELTSVLEPVSEPASFSEPISVFLQL